MTRRSAMWGRIALCTFAAKAYTVVLLFILSRQTSVRDGYEAFVHVPDGETRASRLAAAQESFLERLTPYDGQYYLDIADRGYRVFEADDPGEQRRGPRGNYAFFPLLPFLLHAARMLLGDAGALGAVLLLNAVLSAVAAVGVYCLAQRIGAPPWPSALLVLTFPTAIFQCALYTESLCLCLSVAVAHCAASGSVRSGAALGYLAALTRPQGALVGALWAGRILGPRHPEQVRSAARLRALVAAAAPLLGVATFAAVLWLEIGAPLGFVGIQREWAREFSLARLVREAITPWRYPGPPLDYAAFLLGVGLLPSLWRRLPPELAMYGTLSVVVPLSTGTMLSFGRFLSLSFPHFLCLAMVLEGRRLATGALVAGSIVLQCLIARGLVGWYFVG